MEQLIALVNQGNWQEARLLANHLKNNGENSDTFWVLNSTIYQAEGNSQGEYLSIILGLSQNPYNYELYYMLGEYYLASNANQAAICMEQALFYCDKEDDYEYICSRLQEVISDETYTKKDTSIIITTYNETKMLENCLDSIRQTIPKDSYEIIIVDNASDKKTIDWLQNQTDVKLVSSPEYINYSKAYNIGIQHITQGNDVLLLHSDTIVTPNSFMWLKMGLYENNMVGATGALSNADENQQIISSSFDTINQYINYSHKINLPSVQPYEAKVWLSGFCILISSNVLSSTTIFDQNIPLHTYSLADFGVNISNKGYKLLLCHNSFIFHHCQCHEISTISSMEDTMKECHDYFVHKWGFNITYYSNSRDELIRLIKQDKKQHINVLEIGCGCGSTLSKIKYLYPNSTVYGIELMENVAKVGQGLANIVPGNIEEMSLAYEPESLDYIIFGDVLEHLRDPAATITKLYKYLKPNGKIIASIPNLMHLSVIIPLLQGNFTYTDEGLLDRTHIHFFTKNEIIKMFTECNYKIEEMSSLASLGGQQFIESNKDIADKICSLPGVASRLEFETFQYLVVASK